MAERPDQATLRYPVPVEDDSDSPVMDEGFFVTTDIKDKDDLERRKEDHDWSILEEKGKSTKTLSMSCCNLSRVPQEVLSLTHLTRLYLTYNKMDDLPEEFASLAHLQILNLGFNSFTRIPSVVFGLTSLQVLFLKNNKLTSDGIGREIRLLSNLEELYLGNNNLDVFPEQLCQMMSLRLLTLANNRITKIPEKIGNMKGLKVLKIRSNRLIEVPAVLGEMHSLELACFAQNMIEEFPFDEVANLRNLRDLCLYANRLKDVDALETCFQQLAERGGVFRAEENRVNQLRLGGVCDGPPKLWKFDLLWLHDGDDAVKSWINEMSDRLGQCYLTSKDCEPNALKMANYVKRSRILGVVCTQKMSNILRKTGDAAPIPKVKTTLENYFRDTKGRVEERAIWLLLYDCDAGISPFLVRNGCQNMVERNPDADANDNAFFKELVQVITSGSPEAAPNDPTSPGRAAPRV